MQSLSLPKESWTPYFDRMSRALTGRLADVEVASLEVGDQIAAERMPLLGVTYDSREDLIDVSLGGEKQFSHLIRRPQQIEVAEAEDGVRSIAVTTADGTVQVLRLTAPLLLPQTAGPRAAR